MRSVSPCVVVCSRLSFVQSNHQQNLSYVEMRGRCFKCIKLQKFCNLTSEDFYLFIYFFIGLFIYLFTTLNIFSSPFATTGYFFILYIFIFRRKGELFYVYGPDNCVVNFKSQNLWFDLWKTFYKAKNISSKISLITRNTSECVDR